MNTDKQRASTLFLKKSGGLGKIVIRDMEFGLYLNDREFMTDDIEEGKRFESSAAALAEIARLKLPSAEVISIH